MSGQIGPIPTQYPQGVRKKTLIKLETWSHQTSSATQKMSVQAYSLRPQTVANIQNIESEGRGPRCMEMLSYGMLCIYIIYRIDRKSVV